MIITGSSILESIVIVILVIRNTTVDTIHRTAKLQQNQGFESISVSNCKYCKESEYRTTKQSQKSTDFKNVGYLFGYLEIKNPRKCLIYRGLST
jgi:hypothetical protein